MENLLTEFESSGCDTILLSSERFSNPSDRGYEAGLQYFADQGFHVEVIGYLRRQDRWVESFYRQRLRPTGVAKETRSLSQWCEEEGSDWLNYGERLSTWLQSPLVRSVVLRSYDDISATSDIVADFFEQTELPPRTDEAINSPSVLHNPSLPSSLVELVRAYNGQPDVELLANDRFMRAISELAVQSPTGSLIPDQLWSWLRDTFAPQNELLVRDLMSGPTALFLFSEKRESTTDVHQLLSHQEAQTLIHALREAWTGAQREDRDRIRAARTTGSSHSRLMRRAVGLLRRFARRS